MKKQLIILISLLAGLTLIIGIVVYYLSFRTVTVTLKSPDMTGVIYRYDDKDKSSEVAKINASQSIKLQEGHYGYSANNTKYDNAPTLFTVGKNESTVTIDPSYSRQYLSTLLETELVSINTVITNTYGSLLTNYDVQAGSLYKKGEWYGAAIAEHITPDGNYGDVYRVVLHKIDSEWKIEAKPSLVLTKHDNPTIPKDIIGDINNLTR
jgi:hypothetical protein